MGQQVSDPPPLDIKHLCFPMLLRDSGDMVRNQPHTGLEAGWESLPHYCPCPLYTERV